MPTPTPEFLNSISHLSEEEQMEELNAFSSNFFAQDLANHLTSLWDDVIVEVDDKPDQEDET